MPRKSTSKINSELAVIDFLSMIETEMKHRNISRSKMAKKMNCAPSNITQLFQKTDLLMSTMVSIAEAMELQIVVEYVVQKNRITFKLEQRTNSKGESHVVMYLGGEKDE